MSVDEIEVRGGVVVFEFVGPESGEVVVLTPGGRFSKDYGGVHELAYALADGGKRVLLWDRPNCGRSDVQLYGRTESHMRAETLGLLLRQLDVDRVVAAGGSGEREIRSSSPLCGPISYGSWPCGTSSAAPTAP